MLKAAEPSLLQNYVLSDRMGAQCIGNSQQRVGRQEYVVCHELVYLRVPEHGKGWQALMGAHLSGWRERERRQAGWVLRGI
jgi:hypothetical protein